MPWAATNNLALVKNSFIHSRAATIIHYDSVFKEEKQKQITANKDERNVKQD